MLYLCGRYKLDIEQAWALTPGEFEDVVSGAVDGEYEQRHGFALVFAGLCGLGGHPTSPRAVLGEVEDDGDSPFGEDREGKRQRFFAAAKEKAAREATRWLPPGMLVDIDDLEE